MVIVWNFNLKTEGTGDDIGVRDLIPDRIPSTSYLSTTYVLAEERNEISGDFEGGKSI